MTRLSDLLRGAAERAPIGDVSVSTERARHRIRVQRGVRGVANGLAGAGAAALIVVGAIGTGGDSKATSPLGPEANPVPAGNDSRNAIDGDASFSAWGTCGSYPLSNYAYDESGAFSIHIDSEGYFDVEASSVLDIPVIVEVRDPGNVSTSGPEVAVLYEGMLVGYVEGVTAEEAESSTTGDATTTTVSLALVNCWDGSPLPAGKYEIVASEAFYPVDAEPTPEPSAEPTPEPTAIPEPEPSATPLAAMTTFASVAVAGEEPSLISPIGGPEPLIAPAPAWDDRVVSDPVALTIAGEPVEDPFGAYTGVDTPPDLPDDMLTPDAARALFAAAVTNEPWDMTAGTTRYIIPNYDSYAEDGTFSAYESWYGCSWDGVSGLTFPTESAKLDLLDIEASLPSRINLSYGWVVDGNPLVTYSVTNTSDYSLPGFYGEPNRTLYLVKDGRVVAQAYPVATDQNNPIVYMDSARAEDAKLIAPEYDYWGTFSPGATLSGQYLWRDVSGCWTDGSQATIAAGTYTVLTMQPIYLQSDVVSYERGVGTDTVAPPRLDSELVDPATGSGTSARTMAGADGEDVPSVSPDFVEPYYPVFDYLEIQAWTSLGSVTITTN